MKTCVPAQSRRKRETNVKGGGNNMRMKKRWKTILLSLCMALALIQQRPLRQIPTRRFSLAQEVSAAMTAQMDMTISITAHGTAILFNGGCWTIRPIPGTTGCSCCLKNCWEQTYTFSSTIIMPLAYIIKAKSMMAIIQIARLCTHGRGSDTQAWCKDFAGIEGSSVATPSPMPSLMRFWKLRKVIVGLPAVQIIGILLPKIS